MAHLHVENVTLDYPIRVGPRRLLPGPTSRAEQAEVGIKKMVGSQIIPGRTPKVRALDDVNFELREGDRLALLGHNGSGKSTLLMTVAGILAPTAGVVRSEGDIEALFNIRLGFRREATGRRNIVLRGMVHGLSKNEIEARIDEIVAFSEIGEFIDLPLYTYSAGMAARLAFAIVTALTPQILLLDEWIGAGDRSFQQRAKTRMDDFVDKAGIVILATHNEGLARRICNKALVLDCGRVKAFGNYHEVHRLMTRKTSVVSIPSNPAPEASLFTDEERAFVESRAAAKAAELNAVDVSFLQGHEAAAVLHLFTGQSFNAGSDSARLFASTSHIARMGWQFNAFSIGPDSRCVSAGPEYVTFGGNSRQLHPLAEHFIGKHRRRP